MKFCRFVMVCCGLYLHSFFAPLLLRHLTPARGCTDVDDGRQCLKDEDWTWSDSCSSGKRYCKSSTWAMDMVKCCQKTCKFCGISEGIITEISFAGFRPLLLSPYLSLLCEPLSTFLQSHFVFHLPVCTLH